MFRHAAQHQLTEIWHDDMIQQIFEVRHFTKQERSCVAYPPDRGNMRSRMGDESY